VVIRYMLIMKRFNSNILIIAHLSLLTLKFVPFTFELLVVANDAKIVTSKDVFLYLNNRLCNFACVR
jgi:hypothetical protein